MTLKGSKTGLVALLLAALAFSACGRDIQPDSLEGSSGSAGDPDPIAGAPNPADSPSESSFAPIAPMQGQDEVDQRYRAAQEQRKLQAAKLTKEGEEHFLRGDNVKALEVLSQARYLDKENQEAIKLIGRVTAALDQREGATQDQAMREELRRRVALEQARIQADGLVKRGDAAMASQNYDEARRLYEDALNIVQHGPYGVDLSMDQSGLESRLGDARQKQKEMASAATQRSQSELLLAKSLEEEAETQRSDERIKRLMTDANRNFQLARFEEAERYLGYVKKLADPDSDYAREADKLLEIVKSSRHDRTDRVNRARMAEQWKRVFENLKLASLIQTKVVEFPPDWERTVGRRKPPSLGRGQTTLSEEDKLVERKLDSQVVSLSFEDNTQFPAVINYLQKVSGIGFVYSKGVNEKIGEGLSLTGINTKLPLRDALALVLDMVGNLQFKVTEGIIQVILPEEAKADTYLDLYEVRDLVNPVKDFPGIEINLNPSGAEADEEIDGGDESTNQNFEPDKLVDLIKGNIAKESWEEDPASYSAQIRNGILIVKQTSRVHKQIQELLIGLRKSASLMVALEARFLIVEDNFLEDIGVDFRGLGDDAQGVGQAGRGSNVSFDDFGAPGSPGGVGTPENPAGPGTSAKAGIYYNNNSDGDIRTRTENLYDSLLGNPDVLTNSGGLSFQMTYLDDTEVELILRAVRKSERVNVVTAPRITVFNTERANVTVLNQVSYIKDFDAEIAQAAAIVEPVVDVIQDGVVLDVRPIISSDRRYITMDLRPTVAQLTRPIPQFTASVATGTPVTLELPRLEVQRVRTTVTIPDDATVLLGGLKFSEEQDKYSGIPWLSQIPLISFLTSRRGKYINRRNLLILLKARIIIPDEISPKGGFEK